jgi:RIO kinase 1
MTDNTDLQWLNEFPDDESDDDDEPANVRRARGPKPALKERYESHPDVQRWLREQQFKRPTKPPFEPSFLTGQRDRSWLLSSLTYFYEQDLISDVVAVVKSGKEATVYCCAADPATGEEYLAAKVYRPRMFRSLRNDAVYRTSRVQYDERGRLVRQGYGRHGRRDPGSEQGRVDQVTAWIGYEYETMRRLHRAGADVPRPLGQASNATLMTYIGDGAQAAPLLQEVTLAAEEAQPLFDRALWNIECLLSCRRVHGDLSAYNILYWQGAMTIIDLAQAVDPKENAATFLLLERDIERTYRYFARYGITADPHELAVDLWTRYLGRLF